MASSRPFLAENQLGRLRAYTAVTGSVTAALLCLLTANARAESGQAVAEGQVRYDQHLLVELETHTADELRRVLALADVVLTHDVEVGPLEILIRPERMQSLARAGIKHRTKPHNLQAEIDAERERIQRYQATTDVTALAHQAPENQDTWGDWFKEFQSTVAVDAYMDTLAQLAPERVRVETVGKSLEGRPIRALRIASTQGRPGIIINGTQHAREWYSPSTVSCIADALVRRYTTNAEVKKIADSVEVYVVPMVNPDGYEYSRTKDRMWRKNRRESYGVDPNRNWSVGWSGSSDKNSETYPGPSAFSEPETAAMRDFFESHPQLKGHIDYHTPSQTVLYPDAKVKDLASAVAGKMTAANKVTFGSGSLGTGGGLCMAYGYSKTGLSLTIELRKGKDNSNFGGPPEDIIPNCVEAWAGFLEFAKTVGETVPPPPPPDGGTGGSGGTAGSGGTDGGTPDSGVGGSAGTGGRDSGTGGFSMGGTGGGGPSSGGNTGDPSGGKGGANPSGGSGGNTPRTGGTGGSIEPPIGPKNGCGCRVPGSPPAQGASGAWLTALGSVLLFANTRRRSVMRRWSARGIP